MFASYYFFSNFCLLLSSVFLCIFPSLHTAKRVVLLLVFSTFIVLNITGTLSNFFSAQPTISEFFLNQTYLGVLSNTLIFDSFSYWFIWLTLLLICLSIIGSWNNIRYFERWFFILLVMLTFFLVNLFVSGDIFFFFFWFEAILVPIFLIIGIWGSRQRKNYASLMLFFYTFISSLIFLVGLLSLFSLAGTSSIINLFHLVPSSISFERGLFIWFCFFIAFAVKVPMFPVHLWLPEAHVEAPTIGSVLLAGILLKLGLFGVLRFLLPLFPIQTLYYTPYIFILALLGIIYISCTTLCQIDLKKIIAYTSVAHMSFVVVGIFALNYIGLSGAVFLMLGHGLVSGGLFFLIGFIYDRYKTRLLRYYSGLAVSMPVFAIVFFCFSLANMGFPGSCNFIGELLIILGTAQSNLIVCSFSFIGVFFSAVYSIWLFNRISFGPVNAQFLSLSGFSDLSWREFSIIGMLLVFIVVLGCFPNGVLNTIFYTCAESLFNK